MALMARISQANIVHATKKHTATVFFFHGSGGTAEDMKEWINIYTKEELQFPHIRLVYPSAPSQAYTPNDGMLQNVWFDRMAISNQVPEHVKSIDSMCQDVSKLIEKEVEDGIPYNRIILGGFSMGGALALHLTYRYKPSIAGCFAMSSFLNKGSLIYEHLKINPENNKVPLLQYHGTADTLVPIEWGEETAKNMKELGVNVKFVPLPNMDHDLNRSEVQGWKNWLLSILPDI
ncbi:lysophospholipase-like protein 1 [Harpegnathos saltator]|uniref:palmitoyl-protein hydrolase n=1 Tax=Harpegnathos saltator TaxID=610380 RepID=E2BV86_HARSA|nr:lysophospholipase-like protein 1 [Harpegnathos saltator]EFN80378.1 Lysophospholipase-like protein 1 [Harpegnathos saltator]